MPSRFQRISSNPWRWHREEVNDNPAKTWQMFKDLFLEFKDNNIKSYMGLSGLGRLLNQPGRQHQGLPVYHTADAVLPSGQPRLRNTQFLKRSRNCIKDMPQKCKRRSCSNTLPWAGSTVVCRQRQRNSKRQAVLDSQGMKVLL